LSALEKQQIPRFHFSNQKSLGIAKQESRSEKFIFQRNLKLFLVIFMMSLM